MKSFFVLVFISFVSLYRLVAQPTEDKPRLYWGYYHNDIDNDYLSKKSVSRWVKANLPLKVITTVKAEEIKVYKIELTISQIKQPPQKYISEGDLLSEEMKKAFENINSGDAVTLKAYFKFGNKAETLQLEFAIE
jgi:hypothetical protein